MQRNESQAVRAMPLGRGGRGLAWPALPRLEDVACAALFAFFAMQGSIPGIAPTQALEMTGSAPTALNTVGGILSQAMADGVIVLLLLRWPRLVAERVAGVPWAALLAALAVASSAWSLDPWLTLRRAIPFALAGLLGVYFAARFPLPRQLGILRMTMVALAAASVAVVVLAPSIGLDHSPGHGADWQGVFTQKNACGRMMVLATAAVLFDERRTAGRVAALALFVYVLAMSGSRGAWVIEAALAGLWVVVRLGRRTGARGRLLLAVAAPLAALSAAAVTVANFARLAPLLGTMLGRDATLSGRTAIWAEAVRSIGGRPLLGYGYEAFWRGMQGPSLQISAAVHFVVVHAHNGFLEIALELGAAGVLLFVLAGLRAGRQAWRVWRRGGIDGIAFPVAVLFLIVLYDLDENTLLLYNGLFWVLGVAALVTLDGAFRDRHHTRAADPHAILTVQRPRVQRLGGAGAAETS